MNIGAALLAAQMAIVCKDYDTVVRIIHELDGHNRELADEIMLTSSSIGAISDTLTEKLTYDN